MKKIPLVLAAVWILLNGSPASAETITFPADVLAMMSDPKALCMSKKMRSGMERAIVDNWSRRIQGKVPLTVTTFDQSGRLNISITGDFAAVSKQWKAFETLSKYIASSGKKKLRVYVGDSPPVVNEILNAGEPSGGVDIQGKRFRMVWYPGPSGMSIPFVGVGNERQCVAGPLHPVRRNFSYSIGTTRLKIELEASK